MTPDDVSAAHVEAYHAQAEMWRTLTELLDECRRLVAVLRHACEVAAAGPPGDTAWPS